MLKSRYAAKAKKTHIIVNLVIEEKVLEKSLLGTCEKSLATI